MTRACLLSFIVGAAASPACRQPRTPEPSMSSVVGCFSAQRGPWTPAMDLEDDSVYTQIPDTFRLLPDTLPTLAGLSGRHRVIGTASRYMLNNYWYSPSPDSATVVWSNGTSGVTLDFAVAPGTVVATARTSWDFPRQSQVATVTLLRRPCS